MRGQAGITAYIALGANLGERKQNIQTAINKLAATKGIEVVRISSLMENPAVGGGPNAPPFINAAAEIQTTLGSHTLLHELLRIENEMGRVRREKWEERIIDLDLLLFGDQIISSQELVVPHPLMHERRFVLQPLAEIAPDAVNPVLHITFAVLLDDISNK